ncbi:MAG: hypothetical protein DWQ34_15630 [Planctomycetota bacterium]|nr:MAG: hypothetical protein DWQ34_15630 [Planctomycetota bacterium]REK20353.1 MAG: hypothetical protein DWQ41_25530 [Planctomycetota bacterium]REK26850.1 MAG: hypothetical protein DWQ45_26830 [Planctomycetota bacterium]
MPRLTTCRRPIPVIILLWFLITRFTSAAYAEDAPVVSAVEGQPLGANLIRVVEALDFLGRPVSQELREQIEAAADERDAPRLQQLIDPEVLFVVHINPELRVKVARGPAKAVLHQGGFVPVLVKILNEGTVTERLRIASPQAGAVYGGVAENSLRRQEQLELGNDQLTEEAQSGRFLDVEMFTSPPLTSELSGLEVEYAVALIHSSEAGKREATIEFNIGQGTQDLGFRSEVPVLFDVRPAVPVGLSIRDVDGSPTMAKLTIRDRSGRVYPPQAKRLAPDFFFQPHVYRADGETVPLPPGDYEVTSSRGPEYVELTQTVAIPDSDAAEIDVPLERWIAPMQHGWYCGDHHIHGAGCAHYQVPTLGVTPEDMFRQVKGEGLNVGCVLTWGPCFDFQRRYFSPVADAVSEPLTILKYDLEISGFGSAALGHVCLLNLTDQTYPGSDGTKTTGWPTWTVPVLRWAKEQGGVTGYPHSDMRIDLEGYVAWMLSRLDTNQDGRLTSEETRNALLPESLDQIDLNRDGAATADELTASADRRANEIPNRVLPSMRGSGAMEIFVSVPEGVCDFISAMDTGRVGEWNTWYHLLNCGFQLKVSGETDFPCMSSRRVGQGRVYVRMADGPLESIDFAEWCQGIADGRSYVSDGYAHALEFSVGGVSPGFGEVEFVEPGAVKVTAQVAFARETPVAVAYGTETPPEGRREVGDTRMLHVPRTGERTSGGERLVELVVNGRVVAERTVPADSEVHELEFDVEVDRSSWIALRQFPQMHTNPVNVIVAEQPIRASRASALWCAESVELLWNNRHQLIAEAERKAARAAYDRALETYRQIAGESPDDL